MSKVYFQTVFSSFLPINLFNILKFINGPLRGELIEKLTVFLRIMPIVFLLFDNQFQDVFTISSYATGQIEGNWKRGKRRVTSQMNLSKWITEKGSGRNFKKKKLIKSQKGQCDVESHDRPEGTRHIKEEETGYFQKTTTMNQEQRSSSLKQQQFVRLTSLTITTRRSATRLNLFPSLDQRQFLRNIRPHQLTIKSRSFNLKIK